MTDQPAASGPEIENLMAEARTFPPDPAFSAQANAGPDLYHTADEDYERFWADLAEQKLDWDEPFTKTLDLGAAVRQVVRGWQAQRLVQLCRPPCGGRRR